MCHVAIDLARAAWQAAIVASPAKILGLVQNSTYPFQIVINASVNGLGQSVDYSTASVAVLKFHGLSTDPNAPSERIETWTNVAVSSATTSQLVLTVTPVANVAGSPPTPMSLGVANENTTWRPEVTLAGGVVHPESYFVGLVEAESPKPG